jgi:hypothetical protein
LPPTLLCPLCHRRLLWGPWPCSGQNHQLNARHSTSYDWRWWSRRPPMRSGGESHHEPTWSQGRRRMRSSLSPISTVLGSECRHTPYSGGCYSTTGSASMTWPHRGSFTSLSSSCCARASWESLPTMSYGGLYFRWFTQCSRVHLPWMGEGALIQLHPRMEDSYVSLDCYPSVDFGWQKSWLYVPNVRLLCCLILLTRCMVTS